MRKIIWFVCIFLLVSNFSFQNYLSEVDVPFGGGVVLLGIVSKIVNLIFLGLTLDHYAKFEEKNEGKTSIIIATILLIVFTAIAPIFIFPKYFY